MAPTDKGKAPAYRAGFKDQGRGRDQDEFNQRLASMLKQHYGKKVQRARRGRLFDENAEAFLNAFQTIDSSSAYGSGDELDEDAGVTETNERSEEQWEAMHRSHQALSEEVTHLRAMIERHSQLYSGATPGASGSGSRSRTSEPLQAAPVAVGEPALNNTPPPPNLPAIQPPPARQPRKFVALPKTKAEANIKDIQRAAGLANDENRWNEIRNIIRDLMIRVDLDYENSWSRQDKGKLGVIYSLILKRAPELGVFQNGWGIEWLVQNKFNNHRYYSNNKGKRHPNAQANAEQAHPPALPEPTPPQTMPQLPPPPPLPPRDWTPPPEPLLPLEPEPSREPTPPQPEPESEPKPKPRPKPRPQPKVMSQHTPKPVSEPAPDSAHIHSPHESTTPHLSQPLQVVDSTGGPAAQHLGNPGLSSLRYNTRQRAAATAAAEAQTNAAIEKQKRKRTRSTAKKGGKRRRKSESPLRPLDESDDGGRLTEDEY